ncbi:MAG: cellulose synthase subunit BcsC-related outer membrane protein, partial [Gammaproteobacteria bacterium]|nr:cellulose synthase subunit BcsC-related outer membrane protein [Gammaproteobacteria bacterium]
CAPVESTLSANWPLSSPPTATPRDDPIVRYIAMFLPAIVAFDEQRYDEAHRILKEALPEIIAMSDVGVLTLLGYASMRVGDETTALTAFKQAAETTEDDQFYQAWVDGLLYFKRLDEAEVVLKKMSPSAERDQRLAGLSVMRANKAFEQGQYSEAERLLLEHKSHLDAGGLELLGWIQYRSGKIEAAAESFEAAYRKTPTKGAAQGLVFSLQRMKRYEPLLPLLEQVHGPLEELVPQATREALAQGQRRFNVDSEAHLTPSTTSNGGTAVRIEPTYRNKRGIAGEGRLHQAGVSASVQVQGENDTFKLQLEGQRADNGQEDATGQRFYALWRHGFQNGFESRLGLGRSLSGGAVGAATLGEAGLGYYTADWGLGTRLFRRGNEESLLALSGLRAPLNGLTWGRVLESGLSVDGYRRFGEWNALFSLTRSRLTGEGVADNDKTELYARALHPVPSLPGLALGPELYTSRFAKNLSAFEPGHGGYFSPERFVKLGALASYETRLDRLELKLLAGLGWGWSRQADAPGNPLTGAEPDKYPATQSNGLAYHARLDGLWPIAARWSIGFTLGGQKSPDYTDWRTGVYAQHTLE